MKNEIKTILFASLIMAMILPFSGMNYANAEENKIKKQYTRAEIDNAFGVSEKYVTYTETKHMVVDVKSMNDDEVSKLDIHIMKKYAKLHNKLMNGILSGNEDRLNKAQSNLFDGQFKYLFNADSDLPSTQWFHDLAACGITNGVTSTYPQTPSISIGEQGHSNEQSIRDELESQDLHYVNWPWSDWGDVVYAEKNFTGQEECDNGEFRDEHHVYSPSTSNGHVNSWHTFVQLNEPNPELFDYNHPALWWGGFVQYWHANF